MARKSAHPKDQTNEQVADSFINYGRNLTYYGFLEVVFIAARMEKTLEGVVGRHESAETFDEAREAVASAARKMDEAAGARKLIEATVKRFAFADPFSDNDYDPDGNRSRAVTELLLQHAAVIVNRWGADA